MSIRRKVLATALGLSLAFAAHAQSMKAADVHPAGYPTVVAVENMGKKLERQTVLMELQQESGSWKVTQFDPITEALKKMEADRRAEKVESGLLSPNGKMLYLQVPDLHRGRVYEIRADGLRTADGDKLLHTEAYYTLNETVE